MSPGLGNFYSFCEVYGKTCGGLFPTPTSDFSVITPSTPIPSSGILTPPPGCQSAASLISSCEEHHQGFTSLPLQSQAACYWSVFPVTRNAPGFC